MHLVLTAVLVRESPRPSSGSRARWRLVVGPPDAPPWCAAGIRLLGTAPVLRSLVLVEVFWGVAMIAFETLHPVRLAELVGGEERAGVIIGPVSAASWGLFAVGARPGRTGQPADRRGLDGPAGPNAERWRSWWRWAWPPGRLG